MATAGATAGREASRERASGAGARLRVDAPTFRALLSDLGPSLGLWRAAEVAALRAAAPCPRPVLDAGCGDGLIASLVWRRVEIGVDPWPIAAERARQRGVFGRVVACPVEDVDLPAASVGTVVANSVLEHLPAVDAVLAGAHRLLRRDGLLALTAPTEAFSAWLAVPSARYAAWRNRRLDHVNLWSAAEWARRLAAAGFAVEEIRPYLRRPLVIAWDVLDLLEQVWIARRRLVGLAWRRLPEGVLARLAAGAARLDLSSPPPGGGHLIVARRR